MPGDCSPSRSVVSNTTRWPGAPDAGVGAVCALMVVLALVSVCWALLLGSVAGSAAGLCCWARLLGSVAGLCCWSLFGFLFESPWRLRLGWLASGQQAKKKPPGRSA